jgi:UDP-N-acetylmuramate dehydrogenase
MYTANFPLQSYNTFALKAQAAGFFSLDALDDLPALLDAVQHAPRFFILGKGSNLLISNDFDGLMVHSTLKGIETLDETAETVTLKIASGESWHALVLQTVAQGLWGIENLALIPSSVGAAAVQNIGAYGVELKDTLIAVEGVHLRSGQRIRLNRAECGFGYRDSRFKTAEFADFLILSIEFRLAKNAAPKLGYGELSELANQPTLTSAQVAEKVIAIRQAKLPDPATLANAGSFFKNPVVSQAKAKSLLNSYPTLPHYPLPDGQVKLPAGWLIEQAGWKGHRDASGAGVYEKQALVLVNHGQATGADLIALKDRIQASVNAQFGVLLEAEVIIL